jgi:hypothetical protein
MTLNCALGAILINLIILASFVIGVVLPAIIIGYVLYKLCKVLFFKLNFKTIGYILIIIARTA